MSNGEGLPPQVPGWNPPPPIVPPLPPGYGAGRNGPPWEQQAPSANSFIETARLVITDPKTMFATMRREGGLAQPILYAVVGIVLAALAQAVYSTVFRGGFGRFSGMGGGGFVFTLFMLPLFSIVGLFIGSGIYHLVLMLLGAAKQPFETTCRVVSYVIGTAQLFNIVPICGGFIGALVAIYAAIIGLSEAHEIPVGTAALAVLIPVVVCCVLGGLLALVFGLSMAALIGAASAR